jgi:hypothetical protein
MIEKKAKYLFWEREPETYFSIYGPTELIRNITSDASWYADVKRRAAANQVSVEDRLLEEAIYMLNNQYPEAYSKYQRIQQISNSIRSDSIWFAAVREKAARNFMTEEEMIRADAEYMYWKESQ